MTTKRCRGCWRGFAVAFALVRASFAGNDDELIVGNRPSMTGGTALPTIDDGAASWYNPAGLARAAEARIDVSASVNALRFYSADDLVATRGGASVDGGVAEFVAVPTQLAYVRPLGKGFTLGLGYFVPRATSLVLREGLSTSDGTARTTWQIAAASSTSEQDVAAAFGVALAPNLRVGAGLVIGYESMRGSVSLIGLTRTAVEAQSYWSLTGLVTSDRFGAEVVAGMQADFGRNVSFGAVLRSPRVRLFEASDVSVAQASFAGGAAGQDAFDAIVQRPRASSVGDVAILKAGRLGGGFTYRYGERRWVTVEADFQPPAHDDEVNVHRASVINGRAGLFHGVSDQVALGTGFFSDRSADRGRRPDQLEAIGDFYGGTAGVEIDHAYRLSPGQSSALLRFTSVFALQYAYSRNRVGRFVVDENATEAGPETKQGTLVAHEIALYVGTGIRL